MKIGAIPTRKILSQYVAFHGLKLRLNRPGEFIRAFRHYCDNNKKLN